MRRLLGSLAALTAALVGGCFDDRGVGFVVRVGDTQAESVELFITKDACADDATRGIDCDAISPPGAAVRIPGDIWFRDANATITSEVHGSSASFRIEADETLTLKRVIAVGRDSNLVAVGVATLRDIEVPASSARLLELTLAPAKQLGATQSSQAEAGEYVRVWPDGQIPTSTCVAVEHRTADGVTRDFIVPPTDADCDGIEDPNDCNPAAYKGTDAPDTRDGKAECLATSGDLCMYGDRGCKDGDAPDKRDACYPQHTPTCVPSFVCTGCGGELDRDCFDAIDQMPRVVCTWPTNIGLCMQASLVSFERYLPEGCDQALLATFNGGPDDAPNFKQSVNINASTISVAATTTPSGGCAVKLAWSTPGQAGTSEVLLLRLDSARGRVVLPLRLVGDGPSLCQPQAFQCDLPPTTGAADSMWACVAP